MKPGQPLLILSDQAALLQALEDSAKWDTTTLRYQTKSVWLCELIERMFAEKGKRFCYNSEIAARVAKELSLQGINPDASNTPLSILVYNAQQYVRYDHSIALGYQLFTQALVERVHAEGKRLQIGGEICRTKVMDGKVYAYPPRTRNKYIPADNQSMVKVV